MLNRGPSISVIILSICSWYFHWTIKTETSLLLLPFIQNVWKSTKSHLCSMHWGFGGEPGALDLPSQHFWLNVWTSTQGTQQKTVQHSYSSSLRTRKAGRNERGGVSPIPRGWACLWNSKWGESRLERREQKQVTQVEGITWDHED